MEKRDRHSTPRLWNRQGQHLFSNFLARQRLRQAAFVVLFCYTVGFVFVHWTIDRTAARGGFQDRLVDWDARREEVKAAFVESWDAYTKYAWGSDKYLPLSQVEAQMKSTGLGWIIIDSLGTLMIMNLTEPLAESRDWLQKNLTWDQQQDVDTFQITTRMLGGLLGAHYLATTLPDLATSKDAVYMVKAIELADRLMGAYKSPSGVPYASVYLNTGQGRVSSADGIASSTAEATAVQLEMKYLAYLANNESYWRAAEKVMEVVDDNNVEAGLLPILIDPSTGRFIDREIRLGNCGGSYYEYLIKQYIQTGETIYLEMWQDALVGIETHLITTARNSGTKLVAKLPAGIGGRLSPKMEHQVCFLPGAIALGATEGLTVAEARRRPSWNAAKERQIKLARDLTTTCWGMYAVTKTGIAADTTWFKVDDRELDPRPGDRPMRESIDSLYLWDLDFVIKPRYAYNLQRPETVESLFVMWRITEDPLYRHWGWQIFKAFQTYCRVEGKGYISLDDVTAVPPATMNNAESFWMSQTLKYLYLLFTPSDFLPLTEVVFNTEAHIFPRFRQNKWKTGWERKKHGQ